MSDSWSTAITSIEPNKVAVRVYDIADLFKFETVVPVAFRVAGAAQANRPLDGRPVSDPVSEVRRRCRDAFRQSQILARLIPSIEDVLAGGGLPIPEAPPEAMPLAFEDPEKLSDDGHRG